MKNKIFILVLTIITTCYFVPVFAYEESEGNIFTYKFFEKDESFPVTKEFSTDYKLTSEGKINQKEKESLYASENYWADIIISPVSKKASFNIIKQAYYNVSAKSFTVLDGTEKISEIQAALYGKTIPPSIYPSSVIILGYSFLGEGAWDYDNTNKPLADKTYPNLKVIFQHEIAHALGMGTDPEDKMYSYNGSDYTTGYYKDNLSVWDKNLRFFKEGLGETKIIASPTESTIVTPITSIVPVSDANYIIGLDEYIPYFVGENTLKVLGNDSDLSIAKSNIESNGGMRNYSETYINLRYAGTYKTVNGLPIHPKDDTLIDISHIELRNSYLSHQNYRNWVTCMEAELAAFVDIGYNINLKDYFGKSYYLDHMTDTISTSYSSIKDYAVGVHIYGDNNTITQDAETNLFGEATFGARIDGVQDTFNLNNSIITNGNNSIGVGVTFGKNHRINLEETSFIQAKGTNGIALDFDFGYNIITSALYSKGSHTDFYVLRFFQAEEVLDPEIDGALATEVNIKGSLFGKKAAIYISENAHVENINIFDTAEIKGNIISEWNSLETYRYQEIDMELPEIARPFKVGGPSAGFTDANDTSTWYFTNLNFKNGSHYKDGVINGDNRLQNTLKLNFGESTSDTVTFDNVTAKVYSVKNEGILEVKNNFNLSTSVDLAKDSAISAQIMGNGIINLQDDSFLNLGSNVQHIENKIILNNKSTLNLSNNDVSTTSLGKFELNGNGNLIVDFNLKNMQVDKLKFNDKDDVITNNYKLKILPNVFQNKIITKDKYNIPFIEEDLNNEKLLSAINFDKTSVTTPIYYYGLTFDENSGDLLLSRGNGYSSFNPAVLSSPVAAQISGYATILESFNEGFRFVDNFMNMSRLDRMSYNDENNQAFSDTNSINKAKKIWVNPYTSFENIKLDKGPNVDTSSYGSYFGVDSDIYTLKHDWNAVYSFYSGYNRVDQDFKNVKINYNGGSIGLAANYFKGEFFTVLNLAVGAGISNADTMYGNEHSKLLNSGAAVKLGYNFELKKDMHIMQPSLMLAYSLIKTFNYKNAAGVNITSDTMHVKTIQPQLKYILNTKNRWQPYATVSEVFSITDKAKFYAQNKSLPEMSVRPYTQYGLGIQNKRDEKYTGYFQVVGRNGGRKGVAFSLGFEWQLGNAKK
ncbi:MAG: hypothetical protein MJ247_02910 [Alphaproteobacteria bacterium]|nr:hypothetical protein [Alphaproteobacteria bacterium]